MQKDCEVKPKPKNMKEFFRSSYFWKPFISIIIGGIAGFLYYYFVGCTSGTCPITSHPLPSIITGGVFGFLFTSSPCLNCNS